ncbi:MAG: 4Fe-4S dicluster domain-containing protein, partial [Deltaproteobacteria bacterium]|nr:4Fe-4S dicluster domain-containing protein [Deltaproteobacteria bacterium]
VANLGAAFAGGPVPVTKQLTVGKKNGEAVYATALLGTPVADVLSACGEEAETGDRVILGGPMRGHAVFSTDAPIGPDTDAVMVQAAADIPEILDQPCVNCGECVRYCPARMPVNLLVRALENGLFEQAAAQYDLYSCIECGLCSFVCIAHLPIFQYVMLGKHELAKTPEA